MAKRNPYILLVFILLACNTPRNKETIDKVGGRDDILKTEIQYATGFKVSYVDQGTLVEVPEPYQDAEKGLKYLLIPRGTSRPEYDNDVVVVEVPINNIVCTSTTHIPLLDYLGETDRLIGFPSTDYVSSEKMRKRIDNGAVTDLGIDKELNMELLISLDPDLIMAYTITGNYGPFNNIEDAGIPVVINSEYLEKHPLGRAEWIKFMALFFNKAQEADSVFKSIESKYFELVKIGQQINEKPTVMSGIVYGDTWFLPGGQNFAAKLLKDAGADYLWKEDSTSGFLQLSFESVYEKGHDADLWIGVGTFESLAVIEATDGRYADFKPFSAGGVYSYNAKKGAKGGSEFLELGYLRPDLILADLIKIVHPEKLPDHELYFHERLN